MRRKTNTNTKTTAGRRKGPIRAKLGRRRQLTRGISQESQHSVWQSGALKTTAPPAIDGLEAAETKAAETRAEGTRAGGTRAVGTRAVGTRAAKTTAAAQDNSDVGKGIRVQKLLADRGYGSRRKMEGWIKAGRVVVNGVPAELGHRVSPGDNILVNGKTMAEKSPDKDTRVLLYHKPEGEICSQNDPEKRPNVFQQLPKIRGARWVSIGRLDINTSGLLLFTTNGALANRLMHPSYGLEREYRCRIYGEITKEKLKQLTNGIAVEGQIMQFSSINLQKGETDKRNIWVHVVLSEGRNREVRKLWAAVECQVSRLTRLRYGHIRLPRDLRQGKYRNLEQKEIARLVES